MKKFTKISLLWTVANILIWVNIPLFIAAMGYEYIDFSWYNSLKSWEYISPLFYISATIDMLLYAWLVQIYRKTENLKELLIAVLSCLTQIVLLIWKIKL